MIFGIDISHYQYPVNFDLLKDTNIKFVIIKSSEGATGIDTAFRGYWDELKRINMPRGAYHYYRPLQNREAQAKLFYSLAKDTGAPPVLDVELYRGYLDDVKYYLETSKETKREHLKNLLDYVEKLFGIKPMIYTGYYFWRDNFSPCDWAKDYKLWVANYGTFTPAIPPDWTEYVLHQYSSSGSVAGIDGNTDMNTTPLSLEELYELFRYETTLPPTVPQEIETVEHKTIKIVTGLLNIREYPSTYAKILGTVSLGTELAELEERDINGNIWARVGVKQWVAKVYKGATYANYKYI